MHVRPLKRHHLLVPCRWSSGCDLCSQHPAVWSAGVRLSLSCCVRESLVDVTDAVLHVGQVCSEGGSPPFPAATPRGVPAPCCPAPNNTDTSGWVKSNTPTPTASFPADITDLCVCVLGVNVSFCYQHSPEQSRQRTEADIFWGILWVAGFLWDSGWMGVDFHSFTARYVTEWHPIKQWMREIEIIFQSSFTCVMKINKFKFAKSQIYCDFHLFYDLSWVRLAPCWCVDDVFHWAL